MKGIGITIALVGLSLGSVRASLDPGAATAPPPIPAPPFLLLADTSVGRSGGGAFATPLPFAVVAGDLVVLESATGGNDRANWSEVVRFENLDGHGLATLYSLNDFSGFVLDPKAGNIKYVLENTGDSL